MLDSEAPLRGNDDHVSGQIVGDSAGTIHVLSSPQLRHVGNSIEKPSSAPVESASACDASAVYTDPDERIK
jgi:hypothetical protein